jgi:thiamine-monophosphate kinase
MNEFDLIRRYFANSKPRRKEVICGIGDDAAIVNIPKDHQIVITVDTLVEGIHFPRETSARDIGHKALAVNLSDLAAMGASPAWVTLALTMPKADEQWLQEFSEGFFNLAAQYAVDLIGGDTTRGPLSITVQAHGLVPQGQAVMRAGARPGDLIYVTNTLGNAGLALGHLQKKLQLSVQYQAESLARLNRPTPRIAESLLLRNKASAMIDISDGLAADLSHILQQSEVGATVHVEKIPCSHALLQTVSQEKAYQLALISGDDYELCFTLPPNHQLQLEHIMATKGYSITCIGEIQKQPKLELLLNHKPFLLSRQGYEHFK